ncbi:MAG: hypothetical protein Q8P41_03935 [Pseudomonadota bacterium]|nr:hypothetical protein [Pseudomonadota bacterium]
MRTASLLLPVLLASCAEPDAPCADDCDTAAEPPIGDTGVPIYVQEDPLPEMTAEDVGAALTEVLAHGFPNGPMLRDIYLGMMAEGDESCPGSETIITEEYILGCVAPSGYYYSGVCVYEGFEITDETGSTASWGLGGDFLLKYPSGAVFEAGGGATYMGHVGPDGSQSFESTLRGTWADESSDLWVGEGFSGLFEASGGTTGGQPWLNVHGGVAVGDADLFFDEVAWDWGGACAGKPVGAVHLRDPRGYWYVWTLGDDCDTCGNVVFHDEIELGELCLDLESLGTDAWQPLAMP